MDLSGHDAITRAAVADFLHTYGAGAAWSRGQMHVRGSHGETFGPADFAVQRDIIDVITLGHWANYAQKHHFMRRFDDQTPYQAWTAACGWIHSNALTFAQAAAAGRGVSELQALGNACHTVEDSFAPGHVTRDGVGAGNPGEISHVKLYHGAEKAGHSHDDEEWSRDPDKFDLARNAVKDLLVVVFNAAAAKGSVSALPGWLKYVEIWLKPSSSLRDEGFSQTDLIDRFTSGYSLDEEGLAQALVSDLGTRTAEVHKIFKRLDDHDNTNADDVAEYYVDILKAHRGSAAEQAVARDLELVRLLIKVLSEGWTSSGEQECINYLRTLLPQGTALGIAPIHGATRTGR